MNCRRRHTQKARRRERTLAWIATSLMPYMPLGARHSFARDCAAELCRVANVRQIANYLAARRATGIPPRFRGTT